MKQKATFLLHSFDEMVRHLSNEEAGCLLKAIFDYDIRGIDTKFEDRSMFFLFSQIKSSLDCHSEHYKEVCNKKRESAKKRWEKAEKEKEDKENMQTHAYAWKEKEKLKEKETLKEKERLKENINQTNKKSSDSAEEKQDITNTHKTAYGEFSNVFLTKEEYESFLSKHDNAKERIDSLSAYMKATGKSYLDHYAQLLNWQFYGKSQPRQKNAPFKSKAPGERREPTFDVEAFTRKALDIKYVPPVEED